MKKINVVLTQSLIKDDLVLKDKNVVIIDVLRASTTMTIALTNGAKEIIPSDNVSTAAMIAKGTGNSLLCGERNGKVVEGFDLGNSPLEYSEEVVKDKVLVFSTTNGTSSVVKAKYAMNCVIACFVNLSEVVNCVKLLVDDVILICSGKLNDFCLEDVICAGVIIEQVNKLQTKDSKYIIGDSEFAAMELAKSFVLEKGKPSAKKILKMLRNTEHGKYLTSLGLDKDLSVCSKVDSYPFLPLFKDGIIKLTEKMATENLEKAKLKKINLGNSKSGSSN